MAASGACPDEMVNGFSVGSAIQFAPPALLARLKAIERDFAFIVDDTVTAEALVKAVKAGERALIAGVTVF